MEPAAPEPQNLPEYSPPSQFRAGIPDDLRVPWGWFDVALFVILGVIASVGNHLGPGPGDDKGFWRESERCVRAIP